MPQGNGSAGSARWSPDGTELFYRSLDGRQLLTVPVTTEPTFTTGVPDALFEGAAPASNPEAA